MDRVCGALGSGPAAALEPASSFASEAPAAPPDPAYQDLPLCRDEGEALLRGALQDLMEM